MRIIAEIGLNWNSDKNIAVEMIRTAKECGADYAKFQCGWRPDINPIDDDFIQSTLKAADYYDINLMFSVITDDAFDLLDKYDFQTYKIASRTVKDNPQLVTRVIETGREALVSTGHFTRQDYDFFRMFDNVRLLWCKSSYPSSPEDLKEIPASFRGSMYAGYSDHFLGVSGCILAASRGASIIEKHFTLNKSNTAIRDHVLSATPDEFRRMVDVCRPLHRLATA